MQQPETDNFERNTIIAGVIVMLVGIFLFAANDAMGKWLMNSFTVGQVLFLRSIGAFIVLAPMLIKQNKHDFFNPPNPGLQFLRIICATADTGLFYAAVQYLPLADVMTFYMAGPIYVAAISHFFLNEKMAWRRWMAIAVGFCGVLVALRPSTAVFSVHSLYALMGSICFALVIIFNRVLRRTSDATLVTWQTIGALVIGAVLTIGHWHTPTTGEWGALMLLGIVSCTGHIFIARSLKMAPASILAPLQYTLLLWAIVFGIIFFEDYPDRAVLFGAAIIVTAGLFIFHRKKVVTNQITPTDVGRIGR